MSETTVSGGEWFLELDGRRIDLREGELTIGRSRGCDVIVRDPSVSRGHALLSVREGGLTLQDLRSSNGTYLNGMRLEAEAHLAEGDRLVLGETVLFLRRAAAGDGRPAAAEPALFCPSCGRPVGEAVESCPACGSRLDGERLPRRSEAIALGEVLPVGEVLSASSGSWDATTYRRRTAAHRTAADAADAAEAGRSVQPGRKDTPEPPTVVPGREKVPPVQAAPLGPKPSSGFLHRLARAWKVLRGIG